MNHEILIKIDQKIKEHLLNKNYGKAFSLINTLASCYPEEYLEISKPIKTEIKKIIKDNPDFFSSSELTISPLGVTTNQPTIKFLSEDDLFFLYKKHPYPSILIAYSLFPENLVALSVGVNK